MAPEPVAPVNGFDDLVVDDEPAPPIDDGQPRRSRFDEALELAKRVLDEGVAQRRQDEAERAERQRREEEQAARLRQLLAPLAPLPVSPPLPAPRVPEARQEPEPAAAMGWGELALKIADRLIPDAVVDRKPPRRPWLTSTQLADGLTKMQPVLLPLAERLAALLAAILVKPPKPSPPEGV